MTTQDAVDEMLLIVKQVATDAQCRLVYEDMPATAQAAPLQAPYMRAIVRHATGRQSSLSNADRKRMFESSGTLWIEIYTPIGTGNTRGYGICDMVMNAFSAKRPDLSVWFRNVRMHEAPSIGANKLNQVLVDFSYTQTR